MRAPTARGLGAGVALALLGLGTVGGAPAHAADDSSCDTTVLATSDLVAGSRATVNPPHERMHVSWAHRITRGEGQTVAVLDSGVGAGVGIDVRRQEAATGFGGELLSGHGTIVAGLIAGPDGVAPGADILSMRVLDKDEPDPEQGHRGASSLTMADGLQRLADLHATAPFGVVNISLAVRQHDQRLEAAVRRLQALGVVVVASAGNAAGASAPGGTGDARVYPADYEGVVAVSAVGADPGVDVRESVEPNRDTDVAAPTTGALSVNLNGQRCEVGEIATSYAAAQVSGVLALLRARFPRESAEQVVARLTRTAEGSELGPDPWTGAGVVQAADALTHELSPRRDGTLARTVPEVRADAQAPPAPQRPDVHGPSRVMLLWFGLLAGALVALAFIARPLLRRLG